MSVPGSSRLDGEQSEWFTKKYGIRYLAVQDNADTPSRTERRAQAKRRRKRPDGKTYGG